MAGREFFVGISERTNLGGARAVAAAFPEFPCTPVKVYLNLQGYDKQCKQFTVFLPT